MENKSQFDNNMDDVLKIVNEHADEVKRKEEMEAEIAARKAQRCDRERSGHRPGRSGDLYGQGAVHARQRKASADGLALQLYGQQPRR